MLALKICLAPPVLAGHYGNGIAAEGSGPQSCLVGDYAAPCLKTVPGITGTETFLMAEQVLPELVGVVFGVEMAGFSAGFSFAPLVA